MCGYKIETRPKVKEKDCPMFKNRATVTTSQNLHEDRWRGPK